MNEQSKQDKSKTYKSSKINPQHASINKWETDDSLAGPEKEMHMMTSAEIIKELHNIHSDFLSGIGCYKGTASIQVKEGAKPTRHHQGVQHMHYKNHAKRS